MIQCEFFSFFGIVVNQDSRPHATGQKSLFQVRLQSAETKMTNSSSLQRQILSTVRPSG